MSGERRRLPHSFLLRESENARVRRLNSLDRGPTVVLLLPTINTVYNMAMADLSVNQGHGSQLVTISLIAVKDVHPWESLQRKL